MAFNLTHPSTRIHTELAQCRANNLEKLYPGCKVNIYNDDKCLDYLQTYYGNVYCDLFNRLEMGAHKADLFRYCLLYKDGGYYIDIDNVLLENIDDLCTTKDMVTYIYRDVKEYWPYEGKDPFDYNHISQSFIYTVPGVSLFEDLINYFFKHPVPVCGELSPRRYWMYCRYFYKILYDQFGGNNLSTGVDYKLNDNHTLYLLSANLPYKYIKFGCRECE